MTEVLSVIIQISMFCAIVALIYVIAQVMDVIREERERIGLIDYFRSQRQISPRTDVEGSRDADV